MSLLDGPPSVFWLGEFKNEKTFAQKLAKKAANLAK